MEGGDGETDGGRRKDVPKSHEISLKFRTEDLTFYCSVQIRV